MALIITFLMGMGNFACHQAVIVSGHRMVKQIPPRTLRIARTSSLTLEFIILCGALYAAKTDALHWIWLYGGYFLINLTAAWSIVTRRI